MTNIVLALLQTAQVAPEESGQSGDLLSPNGGLMFWTIVTFVILFIILAKLVFPKITAAVEAREKALEEAIEGAKRDREAAARALAEQQQMLERARREIEQEKERAINEMRREAVELAIAGASKVIEQNLDDQANRKIVETFLSSIPAGGANRG